MAKSPLLRAVGRALRSQIQDQTVLDRGRRDFLKKSSALLGVAVMPGSIFSHRFLNPSSDPVVVLGGGIAGLTSAYRLGQAGVSCSLYEGNQRLGGRVLTQDQFNADGMFCELGAELIDTSHSEVIDLAHELGVKVQELDKGDDSLEEQVFYFGGQLRLEKELTLAAAPLAEELDRDIRTVFGSSADRVVDYRRHNEWAVRLDGLSLSNYLNSFRSRVDRWVLDLIEIAYASEYGLETGEQSALNLLTLVDPSPGKKFRVVGDSDETLRIQGGNSRLIEALICAIQSRTRIHLERKLVKIEDKGSALELSFECGRSVKTVRASQVICTLPFSTLRHVEGIETLGLSAAKLRSIQEMGYGTNSKQILGFHGRPWRKKHGSIPASSGYTFSDLPAQVFWDTSRAQHGKSGILTNFLSGTDGAGPVPNPQTQLPHMDRVFPGLAQLFDGNQASSSWASSPFALGSYACPKVGQYTTIVGAASEPELRGRLLFAGEHVSLSSQGFMNGAVETANAAVKQLVRPFFSR